MFCSLHLGEILRSRYHIHTYESSLPLAAEGDGPGATNGGLGDRLARSLRRRRKVSAARVQQPAELILCGDFVTDGIIGCGVRSEINLGNEMILSGHQSYLSANYLPGPTT